MTPAQERSITLALNILHVGFFECPSHAFEYFIDNDDWALLMAAAGLNAVNTPPPEAALAVLREAVARRNFFAGMTDFKPPAHYCSFLAEQVRSGKRVVTLRQCEEGQKTCPYATFENIRDSRASRNQNPNRAAPPSAPAEKALTPAGG